MQPRHILSQNKLVLVNYDNVDVLKTETNINNSHYIYANMKSGDKIWLGTYASLSDIQEVLIVIAKWLDYSISLNGLEQYKGCTGFTFHMPKKSECCDEPDEIKTAFNEWLLSGAEDASLKSFKNRFIKNN